MIIGLTGAKRAGKDTVAKHLARLYGFRRVAYADAIKSIMLDLNPFVAENLRLADLVSSIGWEAAKTYPEVRRLLQELGVSVRLHTHANVWLDVVEDTLGEAALRGRRIVVTDVRFPNEVEQIRRHRGVIVRINRPGLERDAASRHISERALDDLEPDYTLDNSGTLDDLHLAVRALGAYYDLD